MINKRLLIKNLLAHNDESSFYDKKLQINISSKEGKAKFLKHICALSNSNPNNNSYIVIGVDDQYNHIIGVDFFDDSKIQNLINAYLSYPPIIQYENIPFPHLNDDKVVGLVTIRPKESQEVTSLSKNIWKYYRGSVFFREGSISMPKVVDIELTDSNSEIVSAIEAHAQNNIEYTLDGVFDFMAQREDYNPKYKVFKEYFVICWSGHKKTIENQTFYSRVDIALINEQVRLFYSTLDAVEISYNKDSFEIIEYVNLGLNGENTYFKLEKTTITFGNNAAYSIGSELLFSPPQYDKKALHHIFNANNALMERLKQGADLTSAQIKDLKNVPATYLICYFNGIEAALTRLQAAKPLLHKHSDAVYALYKESMRILRKAKYN
ncbi:ATP-binding protein [Flavobacteriaceae bacterium]|jgi:hypothetical protein|nr:ATP-binding protein [bacterium]MDA9026274.1 ATP-binding protein [Flavobacteriaceae bacterium]|tara:strand:+ start:2821 stop:3960 length:1140 start_codon:yes stop_codon:yes gene_type:complete